MAAWPQLSKQEEPLVAVGYTVIQEVRQAFGDRIAEEKAKETDAPFVGYAKVFPFATPDVDQSEPAILQLESLGLTADARRFKVWNQEIVYHRNALAINEKPVPGGLTPGAPLRDEDEPTGLIHFWKAHSIVVPAWYLQDQNTLYVEAEFLSKYPFMPEDEEGKNRDNFIIDNVVIFYKTKTNGDGAPYTEPEIPIGEREI